MDQNASDAKAIGFLDEKRGINPIKCSYASFVNPNAVCPVCGASVFYYSNWTGSSVFF